MGFSRRQSKHTPFISTKRYPRKETCRKIVLEPEIPEVPLKKRLPGPRTRGLKTREWVQYLGGTKNLGSYEKRIWRPYCQSINKMKKKHLQGRGCYPTVRWVQEKFLSLVAHHMKHIKVPYKGGFYDVYIPTKIIHGSNPRAREENLRRLSSGLSPLGPDGEVMEIHHLTHHSPAQSRRDRNKRIILVFLSSNQHNKDVHFNKEKLLGRGYVGIDRIEWSRHREQILKAVYKRLVRAH